MAKRTRADFLESGTAVEAEPDSTTASISAMTDGMVDTAKEAASQAKEVATQAFGQAKEQATSHVDEQRKTMASGFQAVAQAFKSLGSDLRGKDEGPVAQYAAEIGESIGGQVERIAGYLTQSDLGQIVTDTEEFARKSPALFLGGAFLLGLAASRFLKSSRPAPDLFANMPDPNRALPPASTPEQAVEPMQPAAATMYSGVGL